MSKINELNLPQLKLNSLEETSEFYLECLKPLVNEDVFKHSKIIIEEFIEDQGIDLHKKLSDYVKKINPNSWLMPHAKDVYLANRGPVTILSNYTIETQPYNKNINYLNFVTRLVLAVQDIYLELIDKQIPGMKSKDTLLCMRQLKGFLRGSRTFNLKKDIFKIYEDFSEVNSILIFYKNNIYLLRLFNDDKSRVSSEQIYANLKDIYENSENYPSLPLTLLAYNNHDESYNFINEDIKLKETIQLIDQAMCGISMFDENSINVSVNEKTYGTSFNLWPLKGWSISVYHDLVCTFNNEHTFIDGATSAYLVKHLFSLMNNHQEDFNQTSLTTNYQNLNMDLDQIYLEKIKDNFFQIENQFRSLRFEYDLEDTSKLKEYRINIDAIFQLGYLYANYYTFKELQTIHESVSVAHYYDGRTATMKTITYEGIDFIKAMKNNLDAKEIIVLLKKASDQHLVRIKKTKDFLDIIRLCEGLRLISDQPLNIDRDLGFRKYLDQQICSSSMGNSNLLNRFSYAPVSYNGIGLGYLSKNTIFVGDITYYQSIENEAIEFHENLHEFYDKLKDMMSLI